MLYKVTNHNQIQESLKGIVHLHFKFSGLIQVYSQII